MDQPSGNPVEAPRKMMFRPKVPQRKVAKTTESKIEMQLAQDDNSEWFKLVKEGHGRRPPKVDRKLAPAQVAFGHVNASASAKSLGIHKRPDTSDDVNFEDSAISAGKEYMDPWDYYNYYPIVLPLRRPYSGNPEVLDKEEFEEASSNKDHDETRINPAAELGLIGETDGEQMLLFQLPASLPWMLKSTSASASGNEMPNNVKHSDEGGPASEGSRMQDLPSGFMGKLLVFKSGLIKMKLGDYVFDVSPGMNPSFAQDVAAINAVAKHCSLIGELNKRAVLTPDVDFLLNNMNLE